MKRVPGRRVLPAMFCAALVSLPGSLLGYADGVREGIRLQVGETSLVDVVMEEKAVQV